MFDFIAGTAKQAPDWMRDHGLEWFFRLKHEPRHLSRWYVLLGSDFAWNAALELESSAVASGLSLPGFRVPTESI